MHIRTSIPTWLQCLDRTTAEATKHSQDCIEASVPELDRLSLLYDNSISLVNTDRYAANFKAEKAKREEQPQYSHSHYGCDVHASARAVKHLLNKADGHVTGMISAALSMVDAGSTRVFRECLSQVVEDRLVIRLGKPPEEQIKHVIEVLDLYLPMPGSTQSSVQKGSRKKVKQLEQQRATLLFFLNGDISDETLVEFYTDEWNIFEYENGRERVLRAMQRFLVPALIPGKAPLFSRKSCTGGDGVISYFGILCSFHNVLTPTVQLFTKQSIEPEKFQLVGLPVLPAGDDPMPITDADCDMPEAKDLPSNSVTAESVATGDIDWSEMNRCMKNRFATWANLRPRDALVTMRLGTLQCFWLLYTLLDRGSKAYENRQRKAFLKTGERKYMGQDAANRVPLNSFLDRLWDSFQSQPGAFSNHSCSWELQVLHFRMLASAVCVVEQIIGIPWGSYPIKMFGVLNGRTELLTDPPCLLDQVGHKIRSLASQVSKDELLTVVTVLANDFTMDISQIEAKHASTRRILHMRTVQVSLPSLEDVSASWVCRNNVLDREDRMPCSRHDDPTHGTKPERTERNQRGRQTSSWDIFVHEYFTGQKGQKWAKSDMKKCSEQFALLDENEKERLRKEAVEANLRRELGHRALPSTTSDRSVSDEVQIMPFIEPFNPEELVHYQLSHISNARLMASRRIAACEKEDAMELKTYQHRPDVHGVFTQLLEFLPDTVSSFRAVPAKTPTVDLHVPADSLTQDQQTQQTLVV